MRLGPFDIKGRDMSSSFGKMGSAVDLNTPHVVTASHWAYYLAAGVVLLVIYLLRSEKEPLVDVPYYKAGKTQWMFNADHLVRDSYSKVRQGWRNCHVSHDTNYFACSSETRSTKSGAPTGCG